MIKFVLIIYPRKGDLICTASNINLESIMNQFWGDLLLYGILIKLARLLIICAAIIRVGWGGGG